MPRHKNAFLGSVSHNTPVPRFRMIPIGTEGGYEPDKCLADCDTPENKIKYPYLAKYVNGTMELYLDPSSSSGGTKRRRNRRNHSHKRHRSRSHSKSKSSRRR